MAESSSESTGTSTVARALVTLLATTVIWELATRGLAIPELLLPPPSKVIDELVRNAPLLLWQSMVTLTEILVGFGLAILVGVATGCAIVFWRPLESYLYPLAVATQVVPKVAIAPLILIWFGYGLSSKFVIVFLISFFPILVGTVSGLRAVESELVELALTLKASKWDVLRKVRFPHSIPYIFTGLRVGITTAVIGAVVGEFVGGNAGLGYVIIISNANLNTKMLFAALILLALIGMILFALIVLAERLLVPWYDSNADESLRTLS